MVVGPAANYQSVQVRAYMADRFSEVQKTYHTASLKHVKNARRREAATILAIVRHFFNWSNADVQDSNANKTSLECNHRDDRDDRDDRNDRGTSDIEKE
ncbi:hypothetical protein OCU04_012621 [Sclerotinia nivalis]|uniref:Uncharacterized protein n=1 Tax=Sclerotinia nivalis TaxID=352851 RepID=A0A9X0A927_9HELO|nr:hypothetical protein OCU04_012621 [Sclerotinia nivalis]